ncbi:hypothetical protein [Peribacillus sp. SCS-155]|uniref:hypothetical protein n=1 Tax=Peribacillus sedimenti TaxID=3115297 RepID=UPI0039061329
MISGIGMVAFFLVTSFRLLKTMLLYMLILGSISALIPPLAPIILIIMIVLFIMRIGFVIKNWRPFVAGIVIYGGASLVIGKISANPYRWLSINFTFSAFLEAVIVALIAFFALRATLVWLYQQNYNSSTALGIMGSAPLIIISFILPFLKMHIGGDFFAPDAAVTDGHVMAGGNHVGTSGHSNVMAASDTILPSSETGTVNGTHLQHVQAHVRTAPDGDPTNNLSYHGPDAKPPNMANLVQVDGYVRTAPDGDPTNNLSYHGPDANLANTAQQVHVDDYVRIAQEGDITNNLSHVQSPNPTQPSHSIAVDNVKPLKSSSIMSDEVAASIEPGKLTEEKKKKDI